MSTNDASEVIARLRDKAPGALELARLASPAVIIEPELLRSLRISVTPELDAGAEADLWFSCAVNSRSPDAITLKQPIAEALRTELKKAWKVDSWERERLRAAQRVMEDVHRNLSPALALEERVTWLAIAGDIPGIEEELDRVLAALATGSRMGLRMWAHQALGRLPEEALSTTQGWILRYTVVAHTDTGRMKLAKVPKGLTKIDLRPFTFDLRQVKLGVRRVGESLQLGEVEGEEALAIYVPDTEPRLLILELQQHGQTQQREIEVPVGGTVAVETGHGLVRILTTQGLSYNIPEAGLNAQSAGATKYLTLEQERRFTEVLQKLGLDQVRAWTLLSDLHSSTWEDVWHVAEQRATTALPEFLIRLIDNVFATDYNQFWVFEQGRLLLVSQVIGHGKATHAEASLSGIIGRAAKTKRTQYVPTVRDDPDYVPAEPTTQTELALPILKPGSESLLGVINIESPNHDAFTQRQIEWLEAVCRSFASATPGPRPPRPRPSYPKRVYPKRVFGIETEYDITVKGVESVDAVIESIELVRCYTEHGALMKWDYDLEDPHLDARGFPVQSLMQDTDESAYYELDKNRPLSFEEIKSDLVLSNGARFRNNHYPKYSTPECTRLRDIVAQDKAGERILSECVRRRNKKIAPEREVRLYKNNTDFIGHSYGCHENYLMSRTVPWDRLIPDVMPFLITRQIYAGAGKMGIEGEGSSGQPGVYQISQRSDFFNVLVSIDTMNRRPIIDTRDEPYADPGKYRRFHVIVGDSNMSEFAIALKIGIMGLVLELTEKREAPELEVARPIDAIKSISRDPTYDWIIELKDGRKISAIDIQRMYLEKAQKYCDRSNQEVSWLLVEWEGILNDLEVDFMRCVDRIDWVAKKYLLNTFQESEKLEWTDPRGLQSIDLEYHNIAWEQGLYYKLVRENQIRRILKEDEIKTAIFMPPETTRAYFRGRSIARFNSQIHAIHWDEVVFDQNSGQRRVAFTHASDDEQIDQLNIAIGEAVNYEDFIRRLQTIGWWYGNGST